MRQFQSSAAFLLCSVSLSCWVGIYLASLAFSPSFALSSRQPDTLQLNWTPANDKKSESLRASAAPLAVSSFWIKHIIPITVTIPKHSLWLTCQLITWAESSPTPSPLSLPIPPSFHLSLSLQAPFHPVPQRFGEKAQHGFEIYETRLRGGVLTDEVQTSALTSVPAGRDGSNSSWVIHVQLHLISGTLKKLNVIQVSISIKWHNRIMIWCEIIFMILCFWNKPLLLTKAAIIWSKIKEK